MWSTQQYNNSNSGCKSECPRLQTRGYTAGEKGHFRDTFCFIYREVHCLYLWLTATFSCPWVTWSFKINLSGITLFLRLTPTHPPPGIIQRAETWGWQDVSNWVVGALFPWFAPQTLETQSFTSDHWCHISGNEVDLKALTDTFFKHSSQLLLVSAQGPAHKCQITGCRTQSRKIQQSNN